MKKVIVLTLLVAFFASSVNAVVASDNKEIVEAIKTIYGRKWNHELRYWYIPRKSFNLAVLLRRLESITSIDYSALEAFDKGT